MMRGVFSSRGVAVVAVVEDEGVVGFQLPPESLEECPLAVWLEDPAVIPGLVWTSDRQILCLTHLLEELLAHPAIRGRTGRVRRQVFRYRGEPTKLKRIPMNDAESAFGVGGRIPRARREPTIQLGQRRTREPALFFVVPGIANVLVDDAVGVEVRRVADPAVPTTIVPSESCREMRGHVCAHCTGFLEGFIWLPGRQRVG